MNCNLDKGKFKNFLVCTFFNNSRFLHISHMVRNKTVTGKFDQIGSKQRPEGHYTTIEVCNIISVVLNIYTQILKQSVLKPSCFSTNPLKTILMYENTHCRTYDILLPTKGSHHA